MQRIRAEILPLFVLLLAATYYCHRVYGAFFQLEGDAFFHVYFRLYENMMWADHNPFQWYYSNLISGVGQLNPVLLLVNAFFKLFPLYPSEIARAVMTNMIVAWISTWFLSTGVYTLLRYAGNSKIAALLGGIVVSYTGLHLSGIREFDYVFQSSFMFVAPMLIFLLELCKKEEKIKPTAGLALCVGLSLLGGGNLPMFFYLPFACLLPLVQSSNRLRTYCFLGGALVAAFLIAAPAILPTMTSLQYGNRVEIRFDHIAHSVPPLIKLYTVFLRDWFRIGIIHLHERDYFLGLPVVILALVGFWSSKRRSLLFWAMCLFLFFAIVITHFCYLPLWAQDPIAAFYNRMSMRNSNRFFLLALLPVAYFAAMGFDHLKGKLAAGSVFSMAALNFVLIGFVLAPDWSKLLPDSQIAAILGLSFAFLATLFLWAIWMANELTVKESIKRGLQIAAVAGIFGMYLFAPQQLTSYLLNYLNDPKKVANASSDRLGWPSIMGLRWNYSDVFAQAKAAYQTVPEFLKSPETRVGRILDETELKSGGDNRRNLFAPFSGHKFAFTLVRDHLSSKKMQDLAQIATPAIYDLNNICWVIPEGKSEVVQRKTCLPEAFFVSGFRGLNGSSSVLSWMHQATREDFQKQMAVDCSEEDCATLTPSMAQKNTPIVKTLSAAPGKFNLEVQSKETGFVFLSTHYRPDWVATVNGKEAKVIRANYAFMAVPVEAGESLVEVKLVPKLRYYPMPVSFAVILVLCWVLVPRVDLRRARGFLYDAPIEAA